MKQKIKICPAILESEETEFLRQLEIYSKLFETIDIDINTSNDDFYGQVTIPLSNALFYIDKYPNRFNFHLMLSDPLQEIEKTGIRNLEKLVEEGRVKILVHQESKISSFRKRFPNSGIVIKADSSLRNIGFYQEFSEIQLMTVDTGVQGNKFIPEVLDVVDYLRGKGYKGIISLDGGVNLESAKLIRNFQVDRVSVGSYFSRADDIEGNLIKLELALNM